MCKPPKNIDISETEQPLGVFFVKSSRGFVIVGGRVEPIVCLVFHLVIKMKENLYKKPHQKCKTAVKTFNKYQNVPTGTHKKRKII